MRTRLEQTRVFRTFHEVAFAGVLLATSGCSEEFSQCDRAGTCHEAKLTSPVGSGGSEAARALGTPDGAGGGTASGGAAGTGGRETDAGGPVSLGAGGVAPHTDGGVPTFPTSDAAAATSDAGDAGRTEDAALAVDACTHDCLGGVCSEGVCGAVAIASGLPYPGELAVTRDHVFFMDGTISTGRLVRTKLDGSQFTVLVSGLALPSGLVSDGTHVYFASTGVASTNLMGTGVRSIGENSGPTQTPVNVATRGTASTVTSVTSLAVDAERAYWGTFDGMVYSAPIGGGTPSPVNSVPLERDYHVTDLAVDGTYLYAAQGTTPWFVPRTGGTPTMIDIALGNSAAIAVDDAAVYIRYVDPGTRNVAVGRILKGHSTREDISTVIVADVVDGALAVDEDALYYPTPYGIYSVPKLGGDPTFLSSVVSRVVKIVPRVEGGRKVLYWLNQSELTTSSGNVMRLAL